MTNSLNPDPALEMLVQQARQAAQQSYSPYSRFKVGAAVQLSSGAIVAGANVENVSYGLTICAERSAVVRAIAEYGPSIRIRAVAVANLNDAPSPPCGACRQFLAEFIEPGATVVFSTAEGTRSLAFDTLLPFRFDTSMKKFE
ncbi:MAG TPA: cytidine deaminase [Terracidiphilus sp.]|jgi:cytidine deaminase|nr:cytidine deaminase [Terracidiphilus sp.]